MQLWLCLRLSELAVQCLPQHRPIAVAVLEEQRIHTVNAAAHLLGLEPGMDPASARALVGDKELQMLQRDLKTEQEALKGLCCWAYGITPHLYEFRGDCLMLEISGSLRLFGGAEAIVNRCQRGLAGRGYRVETAMAETPLAAWVLSFAENPGQSSPGSETADQGLSLQERLATVPLTLLHPLHDQFATLERSGLRQLGELLTLPAAALARRCGQEFYELLQHLRGDIQSPPVHFEPPSCFHDSYPLGYPVHNQDELAPALEQLLESLEGYLRQRQFQTRQIEWRFSGPGNYCEHLEVRASAADTPRKDWYRLTRLRLERQPFKNEVELVQLRASNLETARPVSGSLFRQAGQTETPAQLVDVLSNRLGSQAVSGLRCRDAHLPEQSYATVTPGETSAAVLPVHAQRPFWLLSDPEPLHTQGEQLRFWGRPLDLIYGPERIEDGWWDQATSRDYFVARNEQGQRFWVFHERRQKRWFLHGLFA